MAGDDLRGLIGPLAVVLAARAKFRQVPESTYTPQPTQADPNPVPIVVPASTEVYVEPTQLPAQITSNGTIDLGAQVALIQAAVGQLSDQRLMRASATVTPPAMPTVNTAVDVTVPWDEGVAQTVPAVVSLVPVGPGPIQQRSIAASVVTTTTAGVTVRFRTKRALTGLAALDPDDRYVVNALFLYTPPFEGAA